MVINTLIKGAQSCRNYAINFVNGTYLIYLDADDLIASYCFEQRVDYLENHPELDFAVFPMIGFKKQLMDVDTILYGYREMVMTFLIWLDAHYLLLLLRIYID